MMGSIMTLGLDDPAFDDLATNDFLPIADDDNLFLLVIDGVSMSGNCRVFEVQLRSIC